MARIRTIKPGFFLNEQLAELPFQWRLLFIGLWTQADRAGRLQDRAMRLKAELFPYDDLDVSNGLGCLANAGLITRYEWNGKAYIAIPTWAKHQLPHRMEPPSEIEGPDGEIDRLGFAPNDKRRAAIYERDSFRCAYCARDLTDDVRARCVDHVIPVARGGTHKDANLVTACKACNAKKNDRTPEEVGMPWPKGLGEWLDTVDPPSTVPQRASNREWNGREQEQEGKEYPAHEARFERFWSAYPKRVGRKAAHAIWMRLKPSEALTDSILSAVQQQAETTQWKRENGQYVPHPRTWLTQGRWEDEVDRAGTPQPMPRGVVPQSVYDESADYHAERERLRQAAEKVRTA